MYYVNLYEVKCETAYAIMPIIIVTGRAWKKYPILLHYSSHTSTTRCRHRVCRTTVQATVAGSTKVPHVHVRYTYMSSPVRLSVVCKVTFVRPTRAIEISGNVSTPFGTLAIYDLSITILRRSSQGNSSVGGS